MASIELKGVSKAYGATRVLSDVHVTIPNGGFAVLVGPSGCGKSTLLRMIAGLESVSSGDILIAGNRVNEVAPADRDLAMVFQNYALYPHLTVRQNMGFSLLMRKIPASEVEAHVMEAARRLELVPLLDRLPKQLSGGQRQRVAMGRAIVRHPKAFLFDEPLSNLDAKLRVQMRVEIKALHQQLGVTSVYVTHDQIEAMTMADVIIVMDRGQVSQAGSPDEVYDRPANLFVAQFIGSPAMNLFEGVIQSGRFRATCGLNLPVQGPDREHVTLGVRPEAFKLIPYQGDKPKADAITIRLTERTGPEHHVHGVVGGARYCRGDDKHRRAKRGRNRHSYDRPRCRAYF